jgi:hypothetical protein
MTSFSKLIKLNIDSDFLLNMTVCPPSIYRFWLPLWYLGHCVVCPSSAYSFWLHQDTKGVIRSRKPKKDRHHNGQDTKGVIRSVSRRRTDIWLLVPIVLSVLPRFTASDYHFGILAIVLSVLLRLTASDYPFGILWPLCCRSFFGLRLLITPLVSCPQWPIYQWCNQKSQTEEGQTTEWPQDTKRVIRSCTPKKNRQHNGLSFFGLRLLITPLVSCGHCVVCPSSAYDF